MICNALVKVLEFGKKKARPQDKVKVTLRNNNDACKPIYISFRTAAQVGAKVLFHQIESVIQSDETFLALGSHYLKVTTVEVIDGKGRISNFLANRTLIAKRNKSVIVIRNENNLYLPRALVTGIALLEKTQSQEKKSFYKARWEIGPENMCGKIMSI